MFGSLLAVERAVRDRRRHINNARRQPRFGGALDLYRVVDTNELNVGGSPR